ncbi:MAG: trehalase family glycosidase [Victivallales bacterium]
MKKGFWERTDLPCPVLPGYEELVELYYFAWELARKHISYNENLKSPYYMDEACVPEFLWLWDTCFMAEYCRYAPDFFPGIESLDNFYAVQRDDGYISMTHKIATGEDAYPAPRGRINPPLAAWAEWDSYLTTGDKTRLERILKPLSKFDEWIEKNRRRPDGSYWFVDCNSSGMDNSPRTCGKNIWGNNTNFVDLAAQQVLAAACIRNIANAVGDLKLAKHYEILTRNRKKYLNDNFWCERNGFYYDAFLDGNFTGCKTVASFWPLLAAASSEQQAESLIRHLTDPGEFNRPHPVPALSCDNPNYQDDGGYWQGGVWAPANYMIVRGLAIYGRNCLARNIALKHLRHMHNVWKNFSPNTIWECYSPEKSGPAFKKDKKIVRKDFVGWSGLGPIAMLIENILGTRIDYPNRKITWISDNIREHGIRNLPFGPYRISLLAKERKSKHDIPAITTAGNCKFELEFLPLEPETNFEQSLSKETLKAVLQ